MITTPNYDLDIDTTLGGSNASDYVVPSQKAIKAYVDNSTGGNVMWGNIAGNISNQTDLQDALDDKQDKLTIDAALSTTSTNPVQNKVITTELNKKIEGITSSDVTTALGYTPYNSSNPSGYTSNKGTVTKVNNTSPDSSGNVTISIPSAVTESTVSGWGFTKNTGTVTSVNSITPVNGNVTLSIPSVEAYTATEVETLWSSI